ncbi:MAG: hypothetical protein A7316_04790 [Candidatus Altiarchaeales archaeon WOR_SM1_86-2]|nr:MAG: hypothetical protein A7316_04790 [Candidatus Altiarchaeales archaeon WOR_SM1_86-2]ODS40151.1 MAG: hypothetical protein A7315_09420 [Candidatus Altiarchaeales archaeon WOR_SM1_79]
MRTTYSKKGRAISSLDDFISDEQIFVDANIFTFHHLDDPRYGESCTEFLQRIENGGVNGATSNFVLDEVIYVILIEKGCEILNVDRAWKVREEIKRDKKFAKQCYEPVSIFLRIVQRVKSKRFK